MLDIPAPDPGPTGDRLADRQVDSVDDRVGMGCFPGEVGLRDGRGKPLWREGAATWRPCAQHLLSP